jgi:hypothetical protein
MPSRISGPASWCAPQPTSDSAPVSVEEPQVERIERLTPSRYGSLSTAPALPPYLRQPFLAVKLTVTRLPASGWSWLKAILGARRVDKLLQMGSSFRITGICHHGSWVPTKQGGFIF